MRLAATILVLSVGTKIWSFWAKMGFNLE